MNREHERDDHDDLIDLGSASRETKAMTFGADDSKAGLWVHAGLKLD
jgi:hypothetical protein